MVKNLPAMQEMQVQSLGQEDPLEEKMATHSSILRNSMDRGAWWATVHGVTKESDITEQQSCPYCMQLTLGLPVCSSTCTCFSCMYSPLF